MIMVEFLKFFYKNTLTCTIIQVEDGFPDEKNAAILQNLR